MVAGLGLAALGGAGGYQWAKYWGSQELQHETSHGEGDVNPTMRRLKFMVRWSQWQLRAYAHASVEALKGPSKGLKRAKQRACQARMSVLDEVTRAFSPWVQRLYLLRAQGPGTAELEIQEVQARKVRKVYETPRTGLEMVAKGAEMGARRPFLGCVRSISRPSSSCCTGGWRWRPSRRRPWSWAPTSTRRGWTPPARTAAESSSPSS